MQGKGEGLPTAVLPGRSSRRLEQLGGSISAERWKRQRRKRGAEWTGGENQWTQKVWLKREEQQASGYKVTTFKNWFCLR